MKIPESIRVNGREIKVERPEYVHMDSKVCFGKVRFCDGVIEISSRDAEHQHQCITLWHELCRLFLNNARIDTEDEERIVECIGQGIYQVLQDNGKNLFDLIDNKTTG